MSEGTNTIRIAGTLIPVSTEQVDIDVPAVLNFQPFRDWVADLSKEMESKVEKELEIKRVEIQHVDYFGSKIGFIKFKVDARLTENGKNVPGIIFMIFYSDEYFMWHLFSQRGGSVAVLLILRSKGKNEDIVEEHVVLTSQPRLSVPSLAFTELPAGFSTSVIYVDFNNLPWVLGMLDGSGNFVGKASEEIKEETGIEVKEEDLIDMTDLAFGEKYHGAYPSPGGCDEFLRLVLCLKEMPYDEVQKLEGKLGGLRDHGESITVKLMKLNELWKLPDMKALSALTLYNALRQEGKI
ncbi:hypothetical protein G9A89_006603 [Geosiphon pyriformis]|nr:hypothetical protein G9A89_006603 [Geosiphon pyriformis]